MYKFLCELLLIYYFVLQVLKGGDGMAGFAVRNPQGEIVHPYAWKNDAEYEEVSKTGGYYALCIDNQFSKFSAKLVNLYITTFRLVASCVLSCCVFQVSI